MKNDASSTNQGQAGGGAPRIQAAAELILDNVGRVIVGKRQAATLVLVALFSEGHVLLEDVPGVGKTMLAKSMARSLDCTFQRIQFTPDLLPTDVTGLNYFNQKLSEFEFLAGPVFANIVLADEINRATPRTQSCMLQAMEERQVSIDTETRDLPRPFLVMATQNPVEQEGTFPLPEAQLDRFLLRVRQGYPDQEEEESILTRFSGSNPLDDLGPVLDRDELAAIQRLCCSVHFSDEVRAYLVKIVRATREHDSIRLGASPRASQGLYRSCQALAAINGRDFVLPDDVKLLAAPVLAHRLTMRSEARLRGGDKEQVVSDILRSVTAPVD